MSHDPIGAVMVTEHVSLAELTYSETAMRRGILNVPSASVVDRLRLVCAHIVEPARAHFGLPVRINSGYRAPAVNVAVGGAPDSQHVKGEAVDFEIPGVTNVALAVWIHDALAFDQLILEAYVPGQPSSGWVHCSWRANGNRRSVLTMRPRANPKYVDGIRP